MEKVIFPRAITAIRARKARALCHLPMLVMLIVPMTFPLANFMEGDELLETALLMGELCLVGGIFLYFVEIYGINMAYGGDLEVDKVAGIARIDEGIKLVIPWEKVKKIQILSHPQCGFAYVVVQVLTGGTYEFVVSGEKDLIELLHEFRPDLPVENGEVGFIAKLSTPYYALVINVVGLLLGLMLAFVAQLLVQSS